MAAPRLSLIVAMGRNRVIGRGGELPWRISEDLKRFKRLTLGKPVIMGRKTFESIGRTLPGRCNIVVTRNPAFEAAGVTSASGLAEALVAAEAAALALGADEIFVIGGGEIYRAALDKVRRLYVTEVEASPPGDAHFPAIDPQLWLELCREQGGAGGLSGEVPAHSYVVYERRDSFVPSGRACYPAAGPSGHGER